ncbi:MAG: hypothetical protein IJR49_05185, partial [Treponema sp.]|nr:hypothetical protein [Treponema sp.]
ESSSIIYANPFSTTDEWNAKTILSLIETPAGNRGEFIYSSANYIILGLIVEKVSGISLNNYLREKFKLLIAPGFHYFVHWGKLTVTGIQAKLQQFCLGIGANVQAEFHFTESVYLPLGLLFAWDFFGSSHTKAGNTVITADSGFAKWFIVQPRIGIGFHF